MKKTTLHLILATLICLVICATSEKGFAQSDSSVAPAFAMDTLNILAGENPHLGDTVYLVVSFQANATGLATLHLGFPGYVAPPDQADSETSRDSTVNVDSGVSYTYYIPMKLF